MNNKTISLLVNAIVRQTILDYQLAQKRLKQNPHDPSAMLLLGDVVSFLLSDWFVELTNLDGKKYLLS